METPEVMPGLATLGEDLLLLLIKPGGTVGSADKVGFGLMSSELIRLAAAGQVEIAGDRIVVRDAARTGDPDLDGALASLTAARKPPRPRHWVRRPRKGIRDAYLSRLVSAGAVSAERGGIFGGRRYRVADAGRVARAQATLDAIAQSAGQVDVTSAAIGGLAHAVGLGRLRYPGSGGRAPRKRLTEIASGRWTAPAAGGAATTAATQAAVRAARDAAAGG
jgi:Golgi phosphoprotein 3 (GPP34)